MGAGVVVLLLLLAGSYWMGTRKHVENTHETVEASITIPKDATVTAECADMRGKQYIIPKDIPMGPIYDVYQGKVVAMEYLIGQTELTKQSNMFANLSLPKVDYDHLTIMPMDPHAGENEVHFHAIAYLISQSEAAKIKCSGTSMDGMSGSQ
ncbi:MAG TPA: hypothetical protein VGO07_06220 [Candidatus Saccharimonadales bacterium]|jgi:hypothetical protein|nr:hypothetical protein [Candidatus Saccharimonadales bacterium]